MPCDIKIIYLKARAVLIFSKIDDEPNHDIKKRLHTFQKILLSEKKI